MRRSGQKNIDIHADLALVMVIEDFLQNDLSYQEAASMVGLSREQFRYRVRKYKEQQAREKK